MLHSKSPRVRSSSSEMPFASLCPTQVSVAALKSSKTGMTGHDHTKKGMGMASLPSTIDRSQGVGKLTWESKNSDVVTYHVHLPWCQKKHIVILSVNCMFLWSWANNFLCLQRPTTIKSWRVSSKDTSTRGNTSSGKPPMITSGPHSMRFCAEFCFSWTLQMIQEFNPVLTHLCRKRIQGPWPKTHVFFRDCHHLVLHLVAIH